MPTVRLQWLREGRSFEAIAPDDELVHRHAAQLCGWYNAPENAAMMNGSGAMSHDDVIEFWRDLGADGGHGFFGYVDGELVGDADLRGLRAGTAEFAIMIGRAESKGRGIGRALAEMVHVFAFRDLGLARLYVPPQRDNTRVHALNASLGYARDDSDAARAFADSPACETYSIAAAAFRATHERAWREVNLHGVASPPRSKA